MAIETRARRQPEDLARGYRTGYTTAICDVLEWSAEEIEGQGYHRHATLRRALMQEIKRGKHKRAEEARQVRLEEEGSGR